MLKDILFPVHVMFKIAVHMLWKINLFVVDMM